MLNNAFQLDLRPTLPRITAPTLVVRGEFDAARTPAHVAELLAGIPDSRAMEIQAAGIRHRSIAPRPLRQPFAISFYVKCERGIERQHGHWPLRYAHVRTFGDGIREGAIHIPEEPSSDRSTPTHSVLLSQRSH